jgi:signal transduction histidine kinase
VILGGLITLTLGIHYGWILEPIFGSAHWIHAIHGRFCYIPIVIAASWFGLRGGVYVASIISLLVLPFVFVQVSGAHDLVGEIVEIIFYFAIAVLSGALIDRQFLARKKQEEMRIQLERSHQLSMVGQIAAGVAHEIKNPLASIKGALEIISDEKTSPKDKEEFKGILFSEIKRMDGTITEFLNFARPKETKLERLDLSELVPATVKSIEGHASKQGITIHKDVEDGIIIKGDKEKLHELMLNLLLNAIQVSESESTVEVWLEKRNSSSALLAIKDSGEGVKDSDLDRIFEPFYTTKASGTGLGLAIVKAIVESHNGNIEVESRPGQGTKIEVSLPLI